jgi:hypothetical protein
MNYREKFKKEVEFLKSHSDEEILKILLKVCRKHGVTPRQFLKGRLESRFVYRDYPWAKELWRRILAKYESKGFIPESNQLEPFLTPMQEVRRTR